MGLEGIFAGKMLGDGHLNISAPGRRPRLAFGHALKDKEYADYCYELFSQYLPFNPNCKNQFSNYDKRTGKIYRKVYYQSQQCSFINEMYDIWYPNGKKVIPQECVKNNLDTEGLALWYQDDGSLKNNGDRIIISTESFSDNEISFLKELLFEKFNIRANIDTQKRLDISTRKEVRKFQGIVEPLLHKSMRRKSIKEKWLNWQTDWEENSGDGDIFRTTIYLPYEIYKSIRGEGYSKRLNLTLNKWLDKQWKSLQSIEDLYLWIINNEDFNCIEKTNKITPRLNQNIKYRLDLLSITTGIERSHLVFQALMDVK